MCSALRLHNWLKQKTELLDYHYVNILSFSIRTNFLLNVLGLNNQKLKPLMKIFIRYYDFS